MAKNGRDEVEEMLRAAEDELILKLSGNSHTVHKQQSPNSSPLSPPDSSSTYLQSDLASRFDALKTSNIKSTADVHSSSAAEVDLTDDLVARLEVLKSVGKSSRTPDFLRNPVVSATDRITSTSNEEEDEVEKVMRWAMDDARLHPEDKNVSTSTSEEEDDDEKEDEDEEVTQRKKKKKKDGRSKAVEKKGKAKDGKKWFFF